jgi:hypothetical protein
MGLEVLDQVPDLDAIVVPVGGGGLIAGMENPPREETQSFLLSSYLGPFHPCPASRVADKGSPPSPSLTVVFLLPV